MKKYLNWVEISKPNLIYNLRQFRQHLDPQVKIMVVVKANAYGHGLQEIAQIVSKERADWLGVNSFKEGIELRQAGLKTPILILGAVLPEDLLSVISHNLSFVVFSKDVLEAINQSAKKARKKAKIHLKIETGLNRLGIKPANLKDFLNLLKKFSEIALEGVYTHFANADEAGAFEYPRYQLYKFKKAVEIIKKRETIQPLIHIANSAATVLCPWAHFDLVRIGLSLYGLWPSKATRITAGEKRIKIDLLPILSWKTRIAQIKDVGQGETISYGRTFRAKRKTKIAVLPVGYGDGYDRKLSNSGRVLIKGVLAPVVGRICMNMTMVDITNVGMVSREDEVVLIGKQKGKEITADEIAQKIGTINYEVVTRISPLLPRIVV